MSDTDNQLSGVLSRCREGLIAVGALSMAVNLLVLTVSVYMLQVYDRVLPGRSVETLIYLTLIAAGALAAMAALEVMRSRILVRLGIWIDRMLSPALFGRGVENTLRGLPYRTEALRDLATIRSYLGGAGIMALFDAPWMPIYLAFVFLLHPLLGLLALGGAAFLITLALANHALTAENLKRANAASTKGYQSAEVAFRNAEVVDGMGMAPALMRRWDAVNTDVLGLQEQASDTAGLINACTKSLRMFLQVAVLGMGAWLVLRQELSAGRHRCRLDHHVESLGAGGASDRKLEDDDRGARRLEAPFRPLPIAAIASSEHAAPAAPRLSPSRERDLCATRRPASCAAGHFAFARSR